jgi:hypothetical protein
VIKGQETIAFRLQGETLLVRIMDHGTDTDQ